MKCFSSILFFLLLVMSAYGQEIERPQADSLVKLLRKIKPGAERVDILLRLAQFHIFKPGEKQVDFDSATSLMKEADQINRSIVRSSTLEGYRLLVEAQMAREKGQTELSRSTTEKAIKILEAGNNQNYLGRAYYQLNWYYSWRTWDEWRKKTKAVTNAITAFSQAGNLEEKAGAMKMLGDLYLIGSKYDSSIEVLTKALAAYDSINYKKPQGVYELLSRNYLYKDDYKRALQYQLLALKAAQVSGDSTMNLCLIYNTLARIYKDMGRKEIAVNYYRDGHRIALKNKDHYGIALLTCNIAITYNDLQQPEKALSFLATIPDSLQNTADSFEISQFNLAYLETYENLHQYEKAQPYCKTLLSIMASRQIRDEYRRLIYQALAKYYLAIKDFGMARHFLMLNVPFARELSGHVWTAYDAKLLYKLDSAEGNYRKAFSHLLTYKTLSDSVFNETKTRQLQQLEVEFETEKKADSIQRLTVTNQLQKANLRHAELIKNLTIAGIILAVILIGLVYRQYRHKQQSNKIISHKNDQLQHLVSEKEWLLKEVHHRVKNNLQTVVSLLELQAEYLSNDALAAIQASQNRIYATSLLHQKLYHDDNISSINMATYLPELLQHLRDAFNVSSSIHFETTIEPIELDVSQAIPMGLIVNEVITNSIKYAFKGKEEDAVITLSFTRQGNDMAELVITDNGRGLPADKANTSTGLGLELIRGLAEDIEGHAIIESKNGVRTSICFKIRSPLAKVKKQREPEEA